MRTRWASPRLLRGLRVGGGLILATGLTGCQSCQRSDEEGPRHAVERVEESPSALPDEPPTAANEAVPYEGSDPSALRAAARPLFDGDLAPTTLPVVATDPDVTFDPRLVDELTSSAAVVGTPVDVRVRLGSFSGAQLSASWKPALEVALRDLERCFVLGARRGDGASGLRRFELTIAVSGNVTSARPRASQDGPTASDRCAAARLEQLELPPPRPAETAQADLALVVEKR